MISSSRTVSAAGLLLAAALIPAAAAPPKKTQTPEKALATKALPSHFTYKGRRVTVVPLGDMPVMSRVRIPKRDVTVVGLNMPSMVHLGEPFQVSFYIRNVGETTIARVFYRVQAATFLPLAPAEDIGPALGGMITNLPPRRDHRVVHTLTVPSSDTEVLTGLPVVVVTVDPDNLIREDDEDNNVIGAFISGG